MECPECDELLQKRHEHTFECESCDRIYRYNEENDILKESKVLHG